MKVYNLSDIRELKPCYDPADKVGEDWSGTVVDILKLENVLAKDLLWVVTKYLTDKQNRLFAVWCAREALKLVENPDPRSITACDVAEKFANGEATSKKLAAAGDAAMDAARAAWAVAWAAASAAGDADAAYAAYAASDADAASAAGDADAAYADAAQIKRLIEAIEKKEWI
jgi:hypothetical protein